MVHLGVNREATVVEPLDQVHLPQGAVPVQRGAVQPGSELQEFADASGGGQCGAAHVVVHVDVVVEGPCDVRDRAQGGRGALAEGRCQFLAGAHGLEGFPGELRSGVGRRGEQLQPGHVQRVLTGLGEQEGRVDGRDELHRESLSGCVWG